jgi:hypothetical protein
MLELAVPTTEIDCQNVVCLGLFQDLEEKNNSGRQGAPVSIESGVICL